MKFVPHAYQKYCINRMINENKLGLFLDMGLGKTVITLTAVNDLKYNRFLINKVLVIAPKKVAEATWSKEAKKWDHLKLLRINLVLGSRSKRIKALSIPGDIWVINRENVQWLVGYYRNAWPFDMVVIDELSSFKNHQAKRFKCLTWVRKYISRIVGLTGTPASNGYIDLWAEMYLLDEGQRLGKRITHYRERYFERGYDGFSYELKSGSEDSIQDKIKDICVSMKSEDYLELPDCVYNVVPVVLNTKARQAYDKLEKEMFLEVDESIVDAGSAAVLTNKLLQMCNGAVYGEDKKVIEVHDCKIEAFLELIEALHGQPVIVFYNFQHDLARLKKVLSKSNLEVRELKGPQDEADWNNRKIDILLAHPASTAYGLNLQDGGNHAIWFGLTWSLELYEQANRRLHRQGQKQKVFIHHLVVEDSRDEDVMTALENKADMQNALLESLKARIDKVKRENWRSAV
ncbi:DEAD/DEAH box helicase [Sporanaerobacter sp. PP17-6a]|uniref:DEAD/DEAH box helicase n=1 Tax=Sporanaerobacter sp. PP17-6a TaxID=1891289 RepID=UPI0008A01BFD|nr:DEAD/DEAH box helicase [Sporanaerobacter sp. PP17-6a]SCL87969.1 DNA methylase [Sporanaerobacter sp. PP17-6a]